MSTKFIIGTRGSLLAVTQCTLIKEELEKNSKKKFDLKLITTQGDQQTSKPLWQLDGKDFFTKELDSELLSNSIDLVVHSYKDLGSIRPQGIKLAAVTQRFFPNDILLIKQSTIDKMNSLDSFIVGTSSPRRITNIEKSLKDYLPNLKNSIDVKTKMLRGNVNSRIQKLKSDQYDAIVLAHAGIERLALKEDSLKELKILLEGLNFFIMPQKVFPSCASQGALGIEINEEKADSEVYNIIRTVHSDKTFNEIKVEREAFNSYGGGCHLAVGIHAKEVQGELLKIEKGIHNDKEIFNLNILGRDYSSFKNLKAFYPMGKKDKLVTKALIKETISHDKNIFITSSYCFDNVHSKHTGAIFTSGNRTARKMIEKGYWINGSAEGFGHNEVLKLKNSKALKLMMKKEEITVLSHKDSSSEVGEVFPCYERAINSDYKEDLSDYDIFFWSSTFQFNAYTKLYPEILKKKHACGLGKTYETLKQTIDITPFVDISHFLNITGSKNEQ